MSDETDFIRIGDDQVIGVDTMCDARTASLITGYSERHIRDLAVKRTFPIYKLSSNCTRYLVKDLLDWCESKRIDPDDVQKIQEKKSYWQKMTEIHNNLKEQYRKELMNQKSQ